MWYIEDKSIKEIYAAPHEGTLTCNTKDVLTQFATYQISRADIRKWASQRRLLIDEFMLGVNWANSDNVINFICKWNGVTVVDGVYARPGITGAPTFQAGQNRILQASNKMRIQSQSGNTVNPRNHFTWSTNYGGALDFGSSEESSYGQNAVDMSTGVTVTWHYYINGTGAPFFYYDGLNVRL